MLEIILYLTNHCSFFVVVVVAVDFIGGFDYNSAHQPPTKSSRMQMQPL